MLKYGSDKPDLRNPLIIQDASKIFEKTEFNKILVEEPLNLSFKEGIILEADDKSVRIRMTLSEIFSQVEDENREQLFNALFEGRL